MKKVKAAAGVVIILVIAAVVLFLNTSFGKVLTVRYRGFTEISTNIYLDQQCDQQIIEELLQLTKDSRLRAEAFWGELESEPVLIFSDNQERFAGLGLSVNSAANSLFVFNGAKNYIAVYFPKADIDILAHEMSHAELHKRIYQGPNRYTNSQLVPMWFDEGLAMQVDYREKYGDGAWLRMTEEGSSTALSDIVSPAQFFTGDSDERTGHYIVSRYEVKTWYEQHGHERLLELIQGINDGKEFAELY